MSWECHRYHVVHNDMTPSCLCPPSTFDATTTEPSKPWRLHVQCKCATCEERDDFAEKYYRQQLSCTAALRSMILELEATVARLENEQKRSG